MTKDEAIAQMFASRAKVLENESEITKAEADYWVRHRREILDAIARAGFVLMSDSRGFWLHATGDEAIRKAIGEQA